MSFPRIVHAVMYQPWAIERPWLHTIFSLLHSRLYDQGAVQPPPMHAGMRSGPSASFRVSRYGERSGHLVDFSAEVRRAARAEADPIDDPEGYRKAVSDRESALPSGQILHVFGSGILGKHLSEMEEMCAGGLSIDRIQATLREAMHDDKVSGVMLHLDTPGGMVCGCPETAALVRELRREKAVGAFCDSLTGSAGYHVTCAADRYYITPSASVGAIGVFIGFHDYSEWCKKQGIRAELITDGGTHKGAGFPGTSLSDEQRAHLQQTVDEASAVFKGDVRAERAGVSDAAMQGQSIKGARAIDARLADELVNDLDAAMTALAAEAL
jgi:ClpP class serine protease